MELLRHELGSSRATSCFTSIESGQIAFKADNAFRGRLVGFGARFSNACTQGRNDRQRLAVRADREDVTVTDAG